MQSGSRQPVSSETDGVVPLEAGNPPRSTGGDLLIDIGVFVDVYRAVWEVVGFEEFVKAGVCVLQIVVEVMGLAFQVVRVLIWSSVVAGDLG